MTVEHPPRSLVDDAAAWVPPWARPAAQPAAVPDNPVAEPVESAPAESELAESEPAESGPVAVAPTADVEVEPAPDLGTDFELGTESELRADLEVLAHAEPEAPAHAEPAASTSEPPMSDAELRGALEAILLVVDEPVAEVMLAQVLEQPTERVTTMLASLTEEYSEADRGIEVRRAAGGWRLYTRPRYAPYVERFVLDGQQARLTQAALETLAVIAYKQPVTRSRISAIRGVNCDGVIRTLVARGLVEECGSEPDSGAFLYRTTSLFLEKLGLDSVAQLPALAPFLPDDVDEIADAQR